MELFTILLLGIPVWFYLTAFSIFVFCNIFADNENGKNILLHLIVLLVVAAIFYYNGLAATIAILPTMLAFYLAYITVGLAWSFFKWYLYSNDEINIKRMKEYFESMSRKMTKEEFIANEDANPMHYKRNLGLIHNWIIAWPLSMIGTICGDLVIRLLRNLVVVFGNIYHSLSANSSKL